MREACQVNRKSAPWKQSWVHTILRHVSNVSKIVVHFETLADGTKHGASERNLQEGPEAPRDMELPSLARNVPRLVPLRACYRTWESAQRCKDAKMQRCKDAKMQRCEGVQKVNLSNLSNLCLLESLLESTEFESRTLSWESALGCRWWT